jgi:adhesin HecA-like repeat protein
MQLSDMLNNAERRLWEAFPSGGTVALGPGDPTAEGFRPDSWDVDRTVRGEVISRLLLGGRDPEPGRVARVVLEGARVLGEINLRGGVTEYDLQLTRCWLAEPVHVTNATTGRTRLRRTHLPGFLGMDWQTRGDASFVECVCAGELDLMGARIGGRLNLSGTSLLNADAMALRGDGLTVDRDVICSDGFRVAGEVRLLGAHVGGQLDLSGASLTNVGGLALNGDQMVVAEGIFCNGSFTASGAVRLIGAHVGGEVSFTGATLDNPGDVALYADRLTIDGNLVCNSDFTARGELRLLGAHVSGQLSFTSGTLTNPTGTTLIADGLRVDKDLFCRFGFTSTGELRLVGATIGGQLDLTGASLVNPDGTALSADRLTVTEDIFCADGFTASGQLRFLAACIGGRVELGNAVLTNPGRIALDFEGAECPQVELPPDVDGIIDLSRARLGTLRLPAPGHQAPMRLTGLTYGDLDPDPDPPARERIAWLRQDPSGFHPQPYEQLSTYYRSIGHDRDARRVLLAKQRTRRRVVPGTWRRPRFLRALSAFAWRFPGWVVDALSGYGYVPWRAFCWLIAAVLTGAALLRDVAPHAPTGDADANALLLALDATVPTAPFGVRQQVTLTGGHYVVAFCLQILGYALVLAVLPAVSRTLSRSDR